MVRKIDLLESGRLDARGHEILDPTPMAVPAGFKKPESLAETIQRLVRRGLSDAAASQGFETFEESEDFNVEDETFDPSTPFETFFDPVLNREITPMEFTANAEVYRKRYQTAQEQYFDQVDRDEVMRENLVRARWRARQKARAANSGGGEGDGQSPSEAEGESS